MKHLLIIFSLLLTSISWSKDVDFNDLVYRDGFWYEKFSNKPFNNFKCDQEYGYEPKELFKNVNTITSEKDLYFLPYFGKDSKAVTILLSGDSEYYIYIVMDTVSKKYRVFEKNKCGVLPKELLQ